MSASLRRLCVGQNVKLLGCLRFRGVVRTFLSDAHKCDALWYQKLHSPALNKIEFSKFVTQLMEAYDEENYYASRIDFEVLAYKLNEMKPTDFDIVESLYVKYRSSNESVPIKDSTNHALIRNYIDLDLGDRLLKMVKDRHKYGIFPDTHAACLLMDHFIDKDDLAAACAVVYELMLQEDFSHGTSYLMSLYVATRHLPTVLDMDRYTPPQVDPDEETEYIPVKYIRPVVYDDHFDIKDERYLLGKTLYNLGCILRGVMGQSFQLIGLGLYDKFKLANQLLEKWIDEKKANYVVTQEAVAHYQACLESAPTRDLEAPEPTEEECTMDHVIQSRQMTPTEKDEQVAIFKELRQKLELSSETISRFIETRVRREINKFELEDSKTLSELYEKWELNRDEELSRQLETAKQTQAYDRIQAKLQALQNKEELLIFFDKKAEIAPLRKKGLPLMPQAVVTDETADYVEAPGHRDTAKTKSQRKGRR